MSTADKDIETAVAARQAAQKYQAEAQALELKVADLAKDADRLKAENEAAEKIIEQKNAECGRIEQLHAERMAKIEAQIDEMQSGFVAREQALKDGEKKLTEREQALTDKEQKAQDTINAAARKESEVSAEKAQIKADWELLKAERAKDEIARNEALTLREQAEKRMEAARKAEEKAKSVLAANEQEAMSLRLDRAQLISDNEALLRERAQLEGEQFAHRTQVEAFAPKLKVLQELQTFVIDIANEKREKVSTALLAYLEAAVNPGKPQQPPVEEEAPALEELTKDQILARIQEIDPAYQPNLKQVNKGELIDKLLSLTDDGEPAE